MPTQSPSLPRIAALALRRAAFVVCAALAMALLLAPTASAQRGVPVGLYNVNNQVMNSSGYVYAIRFVIDENTTIDRFISGFNLEGSDQLGGREGYADGNGGTIRARLVAVRPDGTPDMSQVLAEETVGAVQRYQESKQAYGAPGKTQLLYFDMGGVPVSGGQTYAMTYQNADSSPASNWFSENSPTVKESVAGPNGVNTLDPSAPGAIAGLDPREAIAWSRDSGKSWVWGRRAGEGSTPGAYAGSATSDDGTRLPWYGWQAAPGAAPQSNQPYYAYTESGSYTLRLRSVPASVVLTEAGGYAPVGASAGVVTVRNLSTGAIGSTASLGSGLARGKLDNPVPVQAGQSYEISNSGRVLKAEGDSFIRSTFKIGTGSWAFETLGQEYDRAQLFTAPHPWTVSALIPGSTPEPAPAPEPTPTPEPTPEPAPASVVQQPEVEEGPQVAPSTYSDLARGQNAVASTAESSALTPRYAVDGTEATRWSSKLLDNQWWRVNLGSVEKINKVSINWEDAYASKYRVDTSRDGVNYVAAAVVTISKEGRVTTKFKPRGARYVRVTGITRATEWGISFSDFEVFAPGD